MPLACCSRRGAENGRPCGPPRFVSAPEPEGPMPQTPRPWFRQQTGWWMAQIDRRQLKLAKGRGSRREAERALRELLRLRDANPAPESGDHTVASVIDL